MDLCRVMTDSSEKAACRRRVWNPFLDEIERENLVVPVKRPLPVHPHQTVLRYAPPQPLDLSNFQYNQEEEEEEEEIDMLEEDQPLDLSKPKYDPPTKKLEMESFSPENVTPLTPLPKPNDIIALTVNHLDYDRACEAFGKSIIMQMRTEEEKQFAVNFLDQSKAHYIEFKREVERKINRNYKGLNTNMRRVQNNSVKQCDPEYLEKRRKNNESAKRSRDNRKTAVDDATVRAFFLKSESEALNQRLALIKASLNNTN